MDKTIEKRTPVRAIRAMCVHCMGDNTYLPKTCEAKHCPLWPYRLGRKPKTDAEWGIE